MSTGLDHREFALVHAGHQMHQETAMVIAIDPTPGREGETNVGNNFKSVALNVIVPARLFLPLFYASQSHHPRFRQNLLHPFFSRSKNCLISMADISH